MPAIQEVSNQPPCPRIIITVIAVLVAKHKRLYLLCGAYGCGNWGVFRAEGLWRGPAPLPQPVPKLPAGSEGCIIGAKGRVLFLCVCLENRSSKYRGFEKINSGFTFHAFE